MAFVQFKKREKHPWRRVKLQASACNFIKINTPPWVFFTFFKLYKCYQIAQRITYILRLSSQALCKETFVLQKSEYRLHSFLMLTGILKKNRKIAVVCKCIMNTFHSFIANKIHKCNSRWRLLYDKNYKIWGNNILRVAERNLFLIKFIRNLHVFKDHMNEKLNDL